MPHIVRQVGKPKRFRSWNGRWVTYKEKIFVPEYGKEIPCIPYDNHSIFETGDTKEGTMPYMCTCGSMAVISGWSSYIQGASAQGLMFLCYLHAATGKHADGSS